MYSDHGNHILYLSYKYGIMEEKVRYHTPSNKRIVELAFPVIILLAFQHQTLQSYDLSSVIARGCSPCIISSTI